MKKFFIFLFVLCPISLYILGHFIEYYENESKNWSFWDQVGYHVGYFFFPVLICVVVFYFTIKFGYEVQDGDNTSKEDESISKSLNLDNFSKKIKGFYKPDLETKLSEIDQLYEKKIINSDEREKMRNKVLGID